MLNRTIGTVEGRNQMLDNSQKDTIIRLVSEFPGLMAIYVHGSVAKGTTHPGSDLDLAILRHHEAEAIDPRQFLEISGELEARMGCPVQIGILSRDSLVFAKEVIAHGIRIYCRDQTYCDTFAMYTFSFYSEFNERRQAILKAYTVED